MKIVKEIKEVEAFLHEFMPKFSVWGIIYLNRAKNEEALRALGITPMARDEIIKNIEKNDYSHTIVDEISYGDMWVFGKEYDGTELYIKISMGLPGTRTICISFHKSEHPLEYPYKND